MEYNQATHGEVSAVYLIDMNALFAGEEGGGHCGNE